MDQQMGDYEQRRKDLRPEANAKRMVLVQQGSFTMGGREEDSPDNERPSHVATLSPYYMDLYPVTNQDYSEFVNCTGHTVPIHWQRGAPPTGLARHPVVNVSWHDAKAYADWSGARLATEAEWERAARGGDDRLYPWGSRFVDGERCNSNNMIGTTLPVDEFPLGVSPDGIYDMSGNAYEWCEDYYDEHYYEHYYKYSPSTNPKGPEGGQERVMRGGFFGETRPNVRTTHRGSAPETYTRDNIGFRLAMSAQ
jgi:sulfatase modifying factor 1